MGWKFGSIDHYVPLWRPLGLNQVKITKYVILLDKSLDQARWSQWLGWPERCAFRKCILHMVSENICFTWFQKMYVSDGFGKYMFHMVHITLQHMHPIVGPGSHSSRNTIFVNIAKTTRAVWRAHSFGANFANVLHWALKVSSSTIVASINFQHGQLLKRIDSDRALALSITKLQMLPPF